MADNLTWSQGQQSAPWQGLQDYLGDAVTSAWNSFQPQAAQAYTDPTNVVNYAVTGSTPQQLQQANVTPPFGNNALQANPSSSGFVSGSSGGGSGGGGGGIPSDLMYNGQLDLSNPDKVAKYNAWKASQGSGGGGSTPPGDPNGNPVQQTEYYNWLKQQQEANQYNQDLQNAYNESNNYLNQAGGVAQSALEAAQQTAQGTYDVNAATLGGYKQSATDTLNQNQTKGTNAYENALADARRIFQEQQMGSQQRFGGSSSAGQAMSEIQGREQARQFGQTNRQYTDLTNQINTQHASVERDYNTQLMQLKQSKDQAISGATQDFNSKLLQISQNRAQLSQDKANASLAALQNLRNQIFTINQQNTQFEQQLALMKQQAQLNLGNYNTTATNYAKVAQPTYTQPTNQTAATSGLGQTQQTAYTGQVSTTKNPYDYSYLGIPNYSSMM